MFFLMPTSTNTLEFTFSAYTTTPRWSGITPFCVSSLQCTRTLSIFQTDLGFAGTRRSILDFIGAKHNISPSCLSSMCQPVSVNPLPSRRCLWSAARGDLVVPATRTVCYGPRSFTVAGRLLGTRCRHHSAMTNCLSLHFAVYSRLNFVPEHTTLL